MSKEGKFFQFYDHFYAGQLKPNQAGECKVKAFCHADKHESMSINVNTGLWNCFACDDMGGDPIDFYIAWKEADGVKVSFAKAKAEASAIAGFNLMDKDAKWTQSEEYKQQKQKAEEEVKPISKIRVDKWNEMLINSKKILDNFLQRRGYTMDTVNRYNLGWDGERITIPIPDENGNIMNVRRYKADEKNPKFKMISIGEGYGRARIFPINNLYHQNIMLCEGELDAILANQLGYFAVTVTGGAGTWREEFTNLFKGKDVVIIYDVDKQGRRGANKIANILMDVAKSIKNVILPITDISNGDLTDYFVSMQHGKEDLDKLIENTPYCKQSFKEDFEEEGDQEIPTVHLSKASYATYAGKRIKTNVVVAGKDTAPYLIPKKIHVSCPGDMNKCMGCKMGGIGMGGTTIDIKPHCRDILTLVDISDRQRKFVIGNLAGVIPSCQSWDFEVLESQNVEAVKLMPELDFSSEGEEYVLRDAFIVGEKIQTNASYQVEGIVEPDPKKQYATLIIDEYKTLEDSVSTFTMTEEIHEELKQFQVKEKQTVQEKFDEIHSDLAYNVTRIYGRNDIMTAVDLTYHSVLSFYFQGKREQRGWVETLIIGDTRTGKSETVMSLQKHYKMGEFITGENVSYAGLIGGLQGSSGRWTLTWGKIPLNDRRLVVIDEASGIPVDSIERMSGVRSSGVAEITKIQTERTHARTRLIWISNDRDGRGLQYYSFGTDAVKYLIGKAEDIARFEFVVTAARNEVDLSIINKKLSERQKVEHIYTTDLCHKLVLWAWSRKEEQIKFTPEAIDLLFKYATEMGTFYTNEIPLVEGANQRIKLARMAIATAARVYSTDNGENIIVKPEHVDFVYNFITNVYKKPSLGYWDKSKQEQSQRDKAKQSENEVITMLNDFPDLGDLFYENNIINLNDISQTMNIEPFEARKYVNFLMKSKMIKKSARGYRKQPTFIETLRKWKQLQGF